MNQKQFRILLCVNQKYGIGRIPNLLIAIQSNNVNKVTKIIVFIWSILSYVFYSTWALARIGNTYYVFRVITLFRTLG